MSIGDVNSTARGSGARYNDGKVELDLIPGLALEDCARVFAYGRRKYAAWNWAKGMQWMVVFGCLLRHLYAWARGEDNDPESGLPHLGHAMCNLVMLSTFAHTYPDGDNRPKGLFEVPDAKALDSVSMDGPPNCDGNHAADNALPPNLAHAMSEPFPQYAFLSERDASGV